ncbi:hypothetical protein ABRP70_23385 [Pectobacterium odoriferum]|uniref:hypothetical protein n=1 Tax=Pectobacterium odoriferum TaxID=78398 RepID=UPI000AFB502D|nr:hypothetical protein [Pectobacterium odoriferum]MCH5011097.1 hypothetical protein [Pectobacterium odoriferum]
MFNLLSLSAQAVCWLGHVLTYRAISWLTAPKSVTRNHRKSADRNVLLAVSAS